MYIAKGSHAIYARTGDIDHTIPNFNTTLPFLLVDHCEVGQPFDPIPASYVYSYTPNSTQNISPEDSSNNSLVNGIFESLTSNVLKPGWLYFTGHWGDEEYKAEDARQDGLLGFHKFVGGPTGPAFKDLMRKKVWPENSHAAGQVIRTSLDGSTRVRDQLRRWGWNLFGGGKRMKVQGSPKRVYVDGTAAGVEMRKDGSVVDELDVDGEWIEIASRFG